MNNNNNNNNKLSYTLNEILYLVAINSQVKNTEP